MPDTSALSSMDDYFVHQLAEPVRYVGDSDRNFYDRHYFNIHACNEDFFMIFGLGQYPNLGTQDGFAALRLGDEQIALRTSRSLGDRGDMSCGPIKVEVLEGLKRLRLTIAPNDSGIEAELIFNGVHTPALEPRQHQRSHGRTVLNVMRYSQNCFYEGWIKLPNGRIYDASKGDKLQGYRDRSWGVRAVGEYEPAGIRGQHNATGSVGAAQNFRWLHMPMQFDDFSLNCKMHEDNDGTMYLEEAIRIWHDERPSEHLGKPDLDFYYSDCGRYIDRARVTFTKAGETPTVLNVKGLVPLFLDGGTGYARSKEHDWTHGQYRGDLVTDVVRYNVTEPNPALFGGIDCLAHMNYEGHTGFGLFEYGVVGQVDRDGIKGPGHFNKQQAMIGDQK